MFVCDCWFASPSSMLTSFMGYSISSGIFVALKRPWVLRDLYPLVSISALPAPALGFGPIDFVTFFLLKDLLKDPAGFDMRAIGWRFWLCMTLSFLADLYYCSTRSTDGFPLILWPSCEKPSWSLIWPGITVWGWLATWPPVTGLLLPYWSRIFEAECSFKI